MFMAVVAPIPMENITTIKTLMGWVALARPATIFLSAAVRPSKAPSNIGSADPNTQPQ